MNLNLAEDTGKNSDLDWKVGIEPDIGEDTEKLLQEVDIVEWNLEEDIAEKDMSSC